MRNYRFERPTTLVDVAVSPKDDGDAKNPNTIYDVTVRRPGKRTGRKVYTITAPSRAQAARMGYELYKNDTDGEES